MGPAVFPLACLAYLVAAMFGVFTFNAVYLHVSQIATQCSMHMKNSSLRVAQTAVGCAAAVGNAMAVDMTWQNFNHNDALSSDFGNSLRDSDDNMIFGTLARVEQIVMGLGMRQGAPKFHTPPPGVTRRIKDDFVLRNSRHMGGNSMPSNTSRAFGVTDMVQAGSGNNFSGQLFGKLGDANRRDSGLYKEPPTED
ncbi:hypothetical protein ACQEU3_20785 [Spirillospora sp. CA-253888]